VIAVDTNVLVYAHREDSDFHQTALDRLSDLATSGSRWAIPWPCVHEFISITTHPKIYDPPSPLATSLDELSVWMDSAYCEMIGEGPGYFDTLADISQAGRVRGPKIHDARIAAICMHHGVRELWSADRDFNRFGGLKIMNPLI